MKDLGHFDIFLPLFQKFTTLVLDVNFGTLVMSRIWTWVEGRRSVGGCQQEPWSDVKTFTSLLLLLFTVLPQK